MDMRTIIGRFGWAAVIGAAVAVGGVTEGGQLIELPVPPGTQAVDVTGICPTADFVVGYLIVNQSPLAVCWRGGCNGEAEIMYLPDPGGGTSGPSRALACGINDAGQLVIVGDSWSIDQPVAIVWIDGVVAEVVSTGVPFPWGIGFRDCSADGCVRVGVYASDGPPFMPLGQVGSAPHFIFPMEDISGSTANCVSPDGILVGMERLADGGWRVYHRNVGDFTTDYDPPPGELSAYPTDILNNGRACGGANWRAVRWFANGTPQALDQLPGELFAWANGMANDRTVVGSSTDNSWAQIGVVWPGDGTAIVEYETYLTDRGITVPADVDFTSVGAISQDGNRIAATMMRNGEPYACIAYFDGACDDLGGSACETVPGDMNNDGVVDLGDVDGFIAAALGGPNAECADITGDGQFNADDFPAFIDQIDDTVPGGLVTVDAQRATVPTACSGSFWNVNADLPTGDQIVTSRIEIQLDHPDYVLTQHPDGDDFPPSDSELLDDPTRACDTYGDIPTWFFDDPEAIIAVLDSVSSDQFWVFAAGLTDVEIDLKVTDTGGTVTRYGIDGPFAPILDTEAFSGAGLPAAANAGSGSSAPRIGSLRVELTTVGNAPAIDVFEFDIVLGGPCTDGSVGFTDLALLLGNWGCADCPQDIDGDGSVGFNDLSILLGLWGPCL